MSIKSVSRKRLLVLVAALAAVAVGCGDGRAQPRVFVARVVAVHDGDTVTVLDASRVERRIRLAGIDAPERHQGFGDASKKTLSDLVYGRDVEVRVSKTDQYSRLVAKIVLNGRDICLEQLRTGSAWFYAHYETDIAPADRAAYAAAAKAARAARRGLWVDAQPVPPWNFRRDARSLPSADPPAGRQPAAASPAGQPPAAGSIVANVRSGIYHLPTCPGWHDVSPRNRRVFATEAAAVAAGYRRARNCP